MLAIVGIDVSKHIIIAMYSQLSVKHGPTLLGLS